jgi:hypothetical protein
MPTIWICTHDCGNLLVGGTKPQQVAYFDSNYDVRSLCFKLFFEFFHELVNYLL